jgi:hypothetical protein
MIGRTNMISIDSPSAFEVGFRRRCNATAGAVAAAANR